MVTAVTIMRLPLTLPCPVNILPGSGGVTTVDGEPVPIAERTELCAVDAQWMMGRQVVCDVHLREIFDNGWLDGTFEDAVREQYEPWGDTDGAVARALRPWSERRRYSQDDALRVSGTA